MAYQYIVAIDDYCIEHELFVKTKEDAQQLCQEQDIVQRNCGDERVIFQYIFGPMAQEIFDEEYTALENEHEDWEVQTRAVQAFRNIQSVFFNEGHAIMQKRLPQLLAYYSSLVDLDPPLDVPDILSETEGMADDTMVPCSFDDIREIIIFALHEGMTEKLKQLLGDIIARN